MIQSDEWRKHRSLLTLKEIEMRKRVLVVSALAVVLLAGGAAGIASAQGQPTKPSTGAHRMEGMPMGGDMMGACSRMMQDGRTA